MTSNFSIKRISKSFVDAQEDGTLDETYDVIVVGSGYGGAISAAKLALAGQKVLLLERGREVLPGEYPRDLAGTQAETQITTAKDGRLTKNNGILDLRVNDDMSVVVGCGLGGTSLINANVSLSPVLGVFDKKIKTETGELRYAWPSAIRCGKDGKPLADPLVAEYEEARKHLGATPLPEKIKLNKVEALKKTADALGYPFEKPPINVSFEDGKNAFGNFQAACTLCGDCCSGCNYGAKNTTLMNYLPYAAANGATLVTEAQVHTVLQGGANWSVAVTAFGESAASARTVSTKLVVLAAGTLGSTEILKRSELAGLALASNMLGQGFSGNGDVLGFGFDANWQETKANDEKATPIYSIGAGTHSPDDCPAYRPGPCIAGTIRIDMDGQGDVSRGVLIEEGVAPGSLSLIYPAIFFTQDTTTANFTRFPDSGRRLRNIATLGNDLLSMKDLAELSYKGATSNTQSYLLMSHDAAEGELLYSDTHKIVTVNWPGVGSKFPFPRDNDILRKASDTIWANYIANPMWSEQFGWQVVSTHPVGGCRMGEDGTQGVVNADCHVFLGTGTDAYEGLMVCDGAVIPCSLGVNPLLTISAVTIRAMDQLIAKRGWRINKKPNQANSTSNQPTIMPTQENIIEAMRLALTRGYDDLARILTLIDKPTGPPKFAEAKKALKDLVDPYITNRMAKATLNSYIDDITEKNMPGDIAPALIKLQDYIGRFQKDIAGANEITQVGPALVATIEDIIGDASSAVSFDETMHGYVAPLKVASHPVSSEYEIGAKVGRSKAMSINATFKVSTDDVKEMMDEPSHPAKLSGSLTVANLGKAVPDGSYDISGGSFELLKQDGSQINLWLMTYEGTFHDGLTFSGYKTLKRREASNWWTDLTTLFVEIRRDKEVLFTGEMSLDVEDFIAQVQTITPRYGAPPGMTSLGLQVLGALRNDGLDALVQNKSFLHGLFLYVVKIYGADKNGALSPAFAALAALADSAAPMLFARLIFQAYGGMPAYLYNFPARAKPIVGAMPDPNGGTIVGLPNIKAESIQAEVSGAKIQITRFNGGKKGPVIVANGLGFRGLGLAYDRETSDQMSFVKTLVSQGYDTWVFDHRGSPQNVSTNKEVNTEYTVDDIAKHDWPWAISTVLKHRTDKSDVQVMAHCLGGLTAMMSVAGGYAKNIRQLIISQFSLHPVTSSFNQMKADTFVATLIHGGVPQPFADTLQSLTGMEGLADMLMKKRKIFDLHTDPPPDPMPKDLPESLLINGLLWGVPFPSGRSCYSPTCHRVFGTIGEVYLHENLDQDTHDFLGLMAGGMATLPFEQLGAMMSQGVAVDAKGSRATYMDNARNFSMPVLLFSGGLNQLVTPDTTLRTYRWLLEGNPGSGDRIQRKVYDGFGHLDCFIGRDASQKIFGDLVAYLDLHAD